MASIAKRPDGQWRARYRDAAGKEHARHFTRKVDAQRWLDEVTTSIVTGRTSTRRSRRRRWGSGARWLEGYASRRPSTVRQAEVHIAQIKAEFEPLPLVGLRPSQVKAWTAKLRPTAAATYVYALHARLAQLMADAVHDGILAGRRARGGRHRARGAAGLRRDDGAGLGAVRGFPGEHCGPRSFWVRSSVCDRGGRGAAGVRRRLHARHRTPAVQWPDEPLKTETSKTAIPIPSRAAAMLSRRRVGGRRDVGRHRWRRGSGRRRGRSTGRCGQPGAQGRAACRRASVPRPAALLRSLLIASGADVKVVQARLRHASAKTTLDTYGHLWPDADESARRAVGCRAGRSCGLSAD